MDILDTQLLEAVQNDFPLCDRPYLDIGRRLGLSEEETIERLRQLRADGLLRRTGAVLSYAHLGMSGILAAVRLAEGADPDRVGTRINDFPEVTHNYLREGEYKVWFTIIAPDRDRQQDILDTVAALPGVEEVATFPVRRSFNIDARFRVPGQ